MEMVTRRLLSGALAGALLLVLLWIGAARPAHGEGTVVAHEADEIVVRLAAGTSLEAIHETHGTTLIRSLVDDAQIYLLQAPEGTSAVTLVGAMSQDSRLLYAELNYVSAAPEAHGVDSWAWTEGDAQASGVDSWAWPEGDAEAQGVDSWAWPEGDADAQGVDSWAWPEDDSM
ncbi:MAG: hypothetical protein R3272_16200, partial [Candidatus Promineifilaceae bacterium]|nr:hypothetical protein [Candidatus Promineifilaceae bacterium]